MLQSKHKELIVGACYPESKEEARRLWTDIKPVKFGDRLTWINSANRQTLAFYQIPDETPYLLILRTECYVYTPDAAAPGFRNFEPPPEGNLQWFINSGTAAVEPYTGLVPIHLLADVDEFIFFKGSMPISLEGVLNAPPDANARLVRTTVYAYLLSAEIADKIGNSESLAFGQNT